MKFLNEIRTLSEEQLKKTVEAKIEELEKRSKEENPNCNIIGYQVDSNPEFHELKSDGEYVNIELTMRCFYNNFISKDTKMVYGLTYNYDGRAGNGGCYYYVDDQEYLYDFCKFIQEQDVETEYEFFGFIRDFLKGYFGTIKQVEREQMYSLLVDGNEKIIPPRKEHSIKDFKGKGNAMCSEYTVMAQNILRLFDFESYFVIGQEAVSGRNAESHAFNMINFLESETEEERHAIIDFMNPVNVWDISYHKVGEEPFIGQLEALDDDFVDRFINQEEHLVFDDYAYYVLGDTLIKLGFARTRDYFVDTYIHPDKTVNKSKTYSYHQ